MAIGIFNYKVIAKTSRAYGVGDSELTVDALEIPLEEGDIIQVASRNNTIYRTEVTSNVAVGATTIPINIKTNEALGIQNKTPIPNRSIVLMEDLELLKYIKRRDDIYINFSSQAGASQYWTTFSSSGISNHSWNTVTTDNGTTVGTSQITNISTQIQATGIVIPFDCILVGFRATTYRVGNHQSAIGLFVGTPAYNDNATADFTLRAYGAADNSAGPDSNYSQRPIKAEDLTRSFSLSAGDVILPAFNSVTNNGGNFRANYQIVLRYKKLD